MESKTALKDPCLQLLKLDISVYHICLSNKTSEEKYSLLAWFHQNIRSKEDGQTGLPTQQ